MIVADIFVRGYRQHVWIMDVVWPLAALYSGPLGIALQYFAIVSMRHLRELRKLLNPPGPASRPRQA